jgi:sugar-specific transcriptional regulator TrmB
MRDELKEGLSYAIKNHLTQREMEAVVVLLEGNATMQIISEKSGYSMSSVQNTISKLKLKGCIKVVDTTEAKEYVYALA